MLIYSEKDIKEILFIINNTIKVPVKEIILFGSYAIKTATDESDIDIAIITKKEIARNEKLQLLNKLWWEASKKGISVDYLIKSESDFESEKKLPTISKESFESGIKIWGKI